MQGSWSQRSRGRFGLLAGALVVLMTFGVLPGCKGFSLFQGLQTEQIIQSDNEKAQNAAALAAEQQCDAAAPHRAQAQLMADETAAYANQGSQLQ